MSIQGEHVLLRTYLMTADRMPLEPTSERLLRAARAARLAGATALKGILGLGGQGVIERSAWSLAEHVPVIVEIVDAAEPITRFVEQQMPGLVGHGLATLERAHVMLYRDRRQAEPGRLSLGGAIEVRSTVPQLQPSATMQIDDQGVLVRVFIGESDQHAGQPLYRAIVEKAHELDLAGATVLRGSAGFGAHSVVHRARLLDMSTDLPIVIEIVDTEDKIQTLLPVLETMVGEGMITMEHVVILQFRKKGQAG